MKKYVPKSCVWELTLKCNMNCIHCGSRAGKARENELSVTEALRVADALIELGCERLTLIGGEVFLYNGWEKIARKLTDQDIKVNLITNGFLFRDKQLQEVRYSGITNVALSIDGMEQAHNTIRNNPKSFSHIQETLSRLNQEKIAIGVNTTLLDRNFRDIDPLYRFLLENNVKIWQLQLANPMGNLKSNQEKPISLTNITKLTRFIHEKRKANKMHIYTGDNIGYYGNHEPYIRGYPGNYNYWSGCQAGLSVVGIDSVGNIKGCESLYDDVFIEGNLREESLANIWFKDGNFAYNRQFKKEMLTGKCKGCDMGAYCRAGCRGASYFTEGGAFENAYCTYNGHGAMNNEQ